MYWLSETIYNPRHQKPQRSINTIAKMPQCWQVRPGQTPRAVCSAVRDHRQYETSLERAHCFLQRICWQDTLEASLWLETAQIAKSAGSQPWARADAPQLLFLHTGQLCKGAISMVLWDLLCRIFHPTEKFSKLWSLNVLEAK